MLHWRLGLDVGTASVGAVAIELDANGQEVGVPWHLVRIFQEPNEKGTTGLTPKKAGRRQARQQRRQLERRARRVRKLAYLAPLLGLDRVGVHSNGDLGRELPRFRAKAARERVELPDLLRIFLRMTKRRGYAGGFRTAGTDKDLGVVQKGSSELLYEMTALAERRQLPYVTLGEFLDERIQRGLPSRLKVGREGVADLFALREMLKDEFEQIWRVQQEHHPVLSGEHQGRPIQDWFREVLFHQRPLKSVSAAVGLCPLEKHLPRAPRAQMAA
jgi:CRISPR-associated endonuclease Csn1